MLKKVKKAILFSVTAICLMMCSASMVSAKECTCEQCQNQSVLITAYPSATADPIQQAEKQGYQKAQEDYHKEAGFQEWRAKKAHHDSDTDLNIFVPMLLILLIFSLILVIWI